MQRTILQRYGVGVLVALVAGVCQYWLQPLVGERFPFAIFPLAVLAASWMGGLGPGLVATAAGTLLGVAPLLGLLAAAIWIAAFLLSRYASVGSLVRSPIVAPNARRTASSGAMSRA